MAVSAGKIGKQIGCGLTAAALVGSYAAAAASVAGFGTFGAVLCCAVCFWVSVGRKDRVFAPDGRDWASPFRFAGSRSLCSQWCGTSSSPRAAISASRAPRSSMRWLRRSSSRSFAFSLPYTLRAESPTRAMSETSVPSGP